jgi:hypothetical protein
MFHGMNQTLATKFHNYFQFPSAKNTQHDTPAHANRNEDTCFGSSVFRGTEKSLFEAIIPFVRPQEKEVGSGSSATTLPAALHSLRQLRAGVGRS